MSLQGEAIHSRVTRRGDQITSMHPKALGGAVGEDRTGEDRIGEDRTGSDRRRQERPGEDKTV